MIGIVDIGIGNSCSVKNALQALGAPFVLVQDPDKLAAVDKIILPGVGSFQVACRKLADRGMSEAVADAVAQRGRPILGICLGMQLLARQSEEGADGGASLPGLGLVDGVVKQLTPTDPALVLPHVGWNDVDAGGMTLFAGIPPRSCFYFVHSYALTPKDDVRAATCDYGGSFLAAVEKGHVFGTQFHPEKSQGVGLKLLANFVAYAGPDA